MCGFLAVGWVWLYVCIDIIWVGVDYCFFVVGLIWLFVVYFGLLVWCSGSACCGLFVADWLPDCGDFTYWFAFSCWFGVS